ncbi:class I SAM-dependent methyltransferase [Erythrobacter sp. HL-111]|uniref:class I SAM-dependent methyltransferase n=1 Tax=Erythrobacter sp. HL-111 TaxID=1798193 RepID=UPI0006DBCCDD|nr:class I SAM-dependent methyltransferase [Erythrobacter sp. HL-111]KPP90144.1 MAG: S-adenosylmethionine-diacylgycerolhomoserine-N-methyltransferase BtaB [Erythrobacteraceae bacterium HL-111]SDR81818.1 S-adenosylmethionine-diacylgycerolhomoserine-N-methlytransferase [Erythrobacter sp. HL-111]
MVEAQGTGHAALMDSVYRGQRHIYDLTRKYYLFGRDTLIEGLGARPGMRVLEVACGTGRNLAKIKAKWPGVRLYGLDISQEMLKNARKALGPEARLGQGDACAFAPADLFGEDIAGFERIVLSYSLSMIPDWESALDHAASHLAPGGELHVVDFGDLSGLPGPLERGLHAWLAKFHVETRSALPDAARRIARERGLAHRETRGKLGYFQLHVLSA